MSYDRWNGERWIPCDPPAAYLTRADATDAQAELQLENRGDLDREARALDAYEATHLGWDR